MSTSIIQTGTNSLFSGTSNSGGKNTTIILPGDKKPKTIGGGRKTEIKADVVSLLFFILFIHILCIFLNMKLKSKLKGCS
jgi:hypothetical protein